MTENDVILFRDTWDGAHLIAQEVNVCVISRVPHGFVDTSVTPGVIQTDC